MTLHMDITTIWYRVISIDTFDLIPTNTPIRATNTIIFVYWICDVSQPGEVRLLIFPLPEFLPCSLSFPHPVLRFSMASSTPFWLLRIMYWCMLG